MKRILQTSFLTKNFIVKNRIFNMVFGEKTSYFNFLMLFNIFYFISNKNRARNNQILVP